MSRLFRVGLAMLALFLTNSACMADAPKPPVPEVSSGKIVWWADYAPAEDLGVADIWIWLPASYADNPDRRYPVLYMHDAENIFDRRLSGFDKEWKIDETITRLAERDDLREWIVVGLRSPQHRYQTYFPEKVFGFLPAEYQKGVTGMTYAGIAPGYPLAGDRYVSMLARELKPKVDREFRTLSGPEDTAIMGSSMGGLISLYAIGEYPEVFGQAAGVSTHLPLTDPDGGNPDQRAAQVAEAFRAYFATTQIDPARNRIYIDHGTATLDAYYAPYFKAFDAMMEGLGWKGAAYESRAFFGAEHEENAWAQRVDIPLSFLDVKDP